jgi:peptidyl-prolyl cis-trans isomerase A (cyclophilin A)
VKSGFYNDCRFFRVVSGFMVQFGINGNPATQQSWERSLKDDPAKKSNRRGYITFATAGRDTRTTQVFINFVDNAFLDSQGFSPFGEVIEGMDNVDKINAEYGETPDQGQITSSGNSYLSAQFPELDYIRKATIIEE